MNINLRNYDTVNDSVIENYKNAREKQSLHFVKNYMHPKYFNFNESNQSSFRLTILEGLNELNKFVDLSDPDVNLPNIVHGYQTAEQIRKDGQLDWMVLVGLIHDLGKIIYLKGEKEDGTSLDSQWSIVGDTFILGCKLPDKIVFPEFNPLHSDKYETEIGIYEKGCGLDNCIVSFGHDEYLYQVLKHNGTTIPQEGLDMIRYHSLYSWHTYGEYINLMNESDYEKLKWVKLFNSYDLYTKCDTIPEIDMEYYTNLIKKYIGLHKLTW